MVIQQFITFPLPMQTKLNLNTLYKYAREWKLFWAITSEFDWMYDWMESRQNPIVNRTVEMVKKITRPTRNSCYMYDNGTIEVYNCCYSAKFTLA